MKTIIKIGIAAAVVASVVIAVPAIRGPFNRAKNNINEALSDEYVVDNYKAEYVAMHEKLGKVKKAVQDFNVKWRVNDKKLALAVEKRDTAKKNLVAVGTADMQAFSKAKDLYESICVEVKNFESMSMTYSNQVAKLVSVQNLLETNMAKTRSNVTALEAKKELVDMMKAANDTVENLTGTGSSDTVVAVEKLDDNYLLESVRLESLGTDSSNGGMSQAEAEAYIESLK